MSISFNSLNLDFETGYIEVKVDESTTLKIRSYLPVEEKGQLVTFVINSALDPNTGCFSPLRTEVYFSLGLAKFYADIDFEENLIGDVGNIYDKLESSGINTMIVSAIPKDEYDFICGLVEDTIADLARFNNSFMGMLSNMSGESTDLTGQIQEIVEQLKEAKGLEVLTELGKSN